MVTRFFKKTNQHENDDNVWGCRNTIEGLDYDSTDPFGNTNTNRTAEVIESYAFGMPRNLKNGDTFHFKTNIDMTLFFVGMDDGSHAPPRSWFREPSPVGSIILNSGESVDFVFGGPSGLVKGPPTYLEELAKLDHYSKPQYIPRDRRKRV